MRTLLIQVADVNRQCVCGNAVSYRVDLRWLLNAAVAGGAEQTTFRGVTLARASRGAELTAMPAGDSMSQGETQRSFMGLISLSGIELRHRRLHWQSGILSSTF